MRVCDVIRTSWPDNGGLDVPLVFELDAGERWQIEYYLDSYGLALLFEPAVRLAQRGVPQAITCLVLNELIRLGFNEQAAMLESFPCDEVVS